MKYLSLFSGVGGFEQGIGEYGECIGYSEIDKYAIQTYERHYEHKNYGNCTTINESELPDFDLLVGGFPCQAFSVAGKRKGFDEARGTLFFDIARILNHKRPRHFVLENVKGLLTHDSGKTFQVIIGILADMGYGVEWQVLNGKRWVPQNRERVIIVGHLRGECSRKIFPFRQTDSSSDEQSKPRVQESEVASTVTATYWKGGKGSQIRTDQSSTSERGHKPNNSNGIRRASHTDVARAVLTPDRKEKRQNGRRFKTDGEPMFTLNTQDMHGVALGSRIRRLTPLECERLMGWEDGWTEGVSDTQRYKQCGNGIIAPMVTEVITSLIKEGCL